MYGDDDLSQLKKTTVFFFFLIQTKLSLYISLNSVFSSQSRHLLSYYILLKVRPRFFLPFGKLSKEQIFVFLIHKVKVPDPMWICWWYHITKKNKSKYLKLWNIKLTYEYVQNKKKMWLCLLCILYIASSKIRDLVWEQTVSLTLSKIKNILK